MADDTTTTGDAIVLERTFAAPTTTVWRLWTEPQHFAAWYGPDGATVTVQEMDLRVGGRRLFAMAMAGPGGPMQMWFTGEHLEIAAPGRLVYTEAPCDEQGVLLPPEQAGMPAGHPTTTQVTVELAPHAEGTHLVLTHAGVPADSPGAAGWAMALDKLAALVADAPSDAG